MIGFMQTDWGNTTPNMKSLKDMCDIIISEQAHMDQRYKVLADELTAGLEGSSILKVDDQYTVAVHIHEVKTNSDGLEIIGLSVEYTKDDTEPNIWWCTTYAGYDEFFKEWKVIPIKEFKEIWNHVQKLMYALLPENFNEQ